MKNQAKEEVLKLIGDLPLNQNKLKQVLEWLEDLSRLHQQAPTQVLQEVLGQVASISEVYPRAEKLREILEVKRFPRFVQKKKEFEEKVKASRPPAFLQINYPPYFQEEGIEVKAKLKSVQDIQNLEKWLKEKAQEFFKEV